MQQTRLQQTHKTATDKDAVTQGCRTQLQQIRLQQTHKSAADKDAADTHGCSRQDWAATDKAGLHQTHRAAAVLAKCLARQYQVQGGTISALEGAGAGTVDPSRSITSEVERESSRVGEEPAPLGRREGEERAVYGPASREQQQRGEELPVAEEDEWVCQWGKWEPRMKTACKQGRSRAWGSGLRTFVVVR